MHTDDVSTSVILNNSRGVQTHDGKLENYSSILDSVGATPRFFSTFERTSYIGCQLSQMKLAAWEHKLSFSPDVSQRNYLLQGVMSGFHIVDETLILSYECRNYKSCESGPANVYLSNLFHEEIRQGLLIPTKHKPHLDARWPGSINDAYILRESITQELGEADDLGNYYILGDLA